MKLRTLTGLEKEATCACGCGQRIPANPDIRVTVDMEGWPRRRYIPSHAPEQPRPQGWRKKEEAKPASAPAPAPPAPAPAGPTPTPPQPQVEPTPAPAPKVQTSQVSSSLGPSGPSITTGAVPTLADNRPWKILTVTISVGDYTSIKAGVADFGRENETMSELGSRLVAELTNDVKTELDVVHQVQAGKPLSVATKGAVTAPQTISPAATAGAPAPKGVVGPEMMETRRLVSMELDDVSAVRSVKKRKIGNQWLKAHGYESFDQVLPTDLAALQQLLAQFEQVNYAQDAPPRSLSEPVFQAASSEAGSSR